MCVALQDMAGVVAEYLEEAEQSQPGLGDFAEFAGFDQAARSDEMHEAFRAYADAAYIYDRERMDPIVKDMARALDSRSLTRFTKAVMRAEFVCEDYFAGELPGPYG